MIAFAMVRERTGQASAPLAWRTRAGFTLLEMLVTLVVVNLLTLLLMQGLLYALQLRTRVLEQQQQQQTMALQEYWFCGSSTALTPGKMNSLYVFTGDHTRFKGLSLAPLRGNIGVPVLIQWRLEFDKESVVLRYQQGEGRQNNDEPGWTVARWQTKQAGFRYRDDLGQWRERWPPALAASAVEPAFSQLPTAIRLDVAEAPAALLWVSVMGGRREPKMDMQEWLLTPDLPPDL